MLGVPASKRIGRSSHVASSYVTASTISPPVRNGVICSRTSSFTYNPPIPVGPSILCPENARKSQSMSCTSTGMCGTLCAPSTSTAAPTARALAASSLTGLMVPTALDSCDIANNRVRGPIIRSTASISSVWSSASGRILSLASFFFAICCQGTRLL